MPTDLDRWPGAERRSPAAHLGDVGGAHRSRALAAGAGGRARRRRRRCGSSMSAAASSRTTRSSPESARSTSGSTSSRTRWPSCSAPVEALPVEDSSFDVVLCTQVLEHCDDPDQAVRELRRVTRPGGRVLASTHGVQVYHPSPEDYWRWTHTGLTRSVRAERRMVGAVRRARSGLRVGARDAARDVHRVRIPPVGPRERPRQPAQSRGRRAGCAEHAAPRAGSGIADPELPRRRGPVVRLLRRNALGVYAVYAAAILSGLLVTPVVIHSIGTSAFGVWSFIGSVTIYLSILDFGVGPSIVRFAAEARGRRAEHDLNEVASDGPDHLRRDRLAHTARRSCARVHRPRCRECPAGPRLGRTDRDLPRRALARGAVPARIVQQPPRRPTAVGPAEPRELRLDRALRGARRRAHASLRRARAARRADTRHDAVQADAAVALAAARAARAASLADVRLPRSAAPAGRLQLLELPGPCRAEDRVLDRCDRRRDRARLGRVRHLFRPGEALRARLRHRDRSDVAHVPRLRRAGGRRSNRPAAPSPARRAAGGLRPDARARAATAADPGPADPGLDRRRVPRPAIRCWRSSHSSCSSTSRSTCSRSS